VSPTTTSKTSLQKQVHADCVSPESHVAHLEALGLSLVTLHPVLLFLVDDGLHVGRDRILGRTNASLGARLYNYPPLVTATLCLCGKIQV
jgi:hypothetical protein